MDSNYKNSEKGQAIVYLVLGLVVFLGFVALAIDGGMAMSNRRHGQNGADAAALAGAAAAGLEFKNYQGYTCNQPWSCNVVPSADTEAKKHAIASGSTNGFTIKRHDESPFHNFVDTSCGGTDWWNAYIDVTVDITATSPSNFLQLVYPDALRYEVEATGRARPGGPIMYGNAIVGLNPQNCTGNVGVAFHGTGDISITGGGVFSNGCLRTVGDSTVDGDPNWDIQYGYIKDYDPLKDIINPPPQPYIEPIPSYAYVVAPPDCPTDPAQWYTDNTLPKTMSGLYCVNGNLSFKKGPYTGNNVTIYLKDGDLTINGSEVVNLNAAPGDSKTAYPAIPGILFYIPKENQAAVTLNGTSQVTITGVVYAPGSDIKLTGTDNVTSYSSTQFIGWNVEVGGNQQTNIVYDGCDGFLMPPSVELNK